MTISRPDWGDGGEGGGRSMMPAAPVVTAGDDALGSRALVAEMENWSPAADVPAGASLQPPADAAFAYFMAMRNSTLPAIVEREINHSADGRDATLSYMRETARGILAESGNPAAFVKHFDTLSDGVQAKAYLAIKRNPGASFLDVLDAVEPQLTLAEMAEAETWARAWKAMAK